MRLDVSAARCMQALVRGSAPPDCERPAHDPPPSAEECVKRAKALEALRSKGKGERHPAMIAALVALEPCTDRERSGAGRPR
jgi:hypothetical protein